MSAPLPFPPRRIDAHKGNFGRCLLIGGSRGMSGAISLSAIAALRTGAGLVTAAVPDVCLETVASFHPSIMTQPWEDDQGQFATKAVEQLQAQCTAEGPSGSSRYRSIGCGPGMGIRQGAANIVEHLTTHSPCTTVLDADAINLLASQGWAEQVSESVQTRNGKQHLVLTPHPGELQRLIGVPPSDRNEQINAAQELAKRANCTVVVKGGPTVVVDATRRWTNSSGNPGMATAGSGDVLTGILTGLLGQRDAFPPSTSEWDLVRLAVWIHGTAGDFAAAQWGQAGMTAMELLDHIPTAIRAAHAK